MSTNVGDVLRDPDGRLREVVAVTHEAKSSHELRKRHTERSAIHVDPDLERKQAQQAPGAQR